MEQAQFQENPNLLSEILQSDEISAALFTSRGLKESGLTNFRAIIDDWEPPGTTLTFESISTTMDPMSFQPPKYIRDMHNAPRFGHTNHLGKLVSSNPEDALDYASGLKQFTLFVLVPFIIWAIILVLFKCLYGIEKIGCAAGGELLDMKELSRKGISRKERKKRIIRSWRLHTTFLIVAILVPTTSLLMMEAGWSKLEFAWEEVLSILNDAESMAYRGWHALDGLQSTKESLFQNELINRILEKASSSTSSSSEPSLFATWCPKSNDGEKLSFLRDAMNTVEINAQSVIGMFDSYIPQKAGGFIAVTEATESVDQSIQWFFEHDWVWKMYLMVLNVLSFLLAASCYIFSKSNIIHEPTRMYLTYFIVPLFCVATFLLLMMTGSSGVAALLNADFCAGGEGPGSPQGTIQDAILSFQYGNLDRSNELTGTLGLVYESFTYYSNGCLTDNPLAFLEKYLWRIEEVKGYVVELAATLPDTPESAMMLSIECGSDVSFLPSSLKELETELSILQSNLNALVDAASCESISPLVRRLTHGSVCRESAHGLTWIWACSLIVCILCFVMITTRAALYNAIKRRKPREKKSKRVVEREFEEYKQFMSDFYEDACEWKMAPEKKKKRQIDFGSQILPNPTFDTNELSKSSTGESSSISEENKSKSSMGERASISEENRSKSSIGESDSISEKNESKVSMGESDSISEENKINLGFFEDEKSSLGESDSMLDENKINLGFFEDDDGLDNEVSAEAAREISYDSSFESDSDDSRNNESDDDSQSAITSFLYETKSIISDARSIFSETKSIASSAAGRAIQQIKKLRPLLGKPKDEDSGHFDEDSIEDASLYLQSPPMATRSDSLVVAGDGLWNYITPPSRGKAFFGKSTVLAVVTPKAPRKEISFLARTKASDAVEHELESLTGTPSKSSMLSLSSNSGLNPRRLRLSPLVSPRNNSPSPPGNLNKKNRKSSSSRLSLDAISRTSQLIRRSRISSEDSDDLSMYIEEAPQRPKKAYRRLRRTKG